MYLWIINSLIKKKKTSVEKIVHRKVYKILEKKNVSLCHIQIKWNDTLNSNQIYGIKSSCWHSVTLLKYIQWRDERDIK